MYTFELNNKFLSKEEMVMFKKCLDFYHVDESIWGVFASLFRSEAKGTKPLIIRAYEDSKLCGAAIVVKCTKYGRAMFNNKLMAGILNFIGIPVYVWMKFGFGAEFMCNPGFAVEPEKADEVYAAMAQFLKKRSFLAIIYGHSDKSYLFPGAAVLPALSHALIDTSQMSSVQDYLKGHKSLKHQMNVFSKKGGTFEIINNVMDEKYMDSVKKCFTVTAEKSVLYLPYQDIYLNSVLNAGRTYLENVYYFVAKLNGEFIGYQAAIKTGTCLNALNGAFDRELGTTHHAYEVLFVKMAEFAIENGLKSIDFGSVVNVTKQRMINKSVDMSYFLFSKYRVVQWLFNKFLKISKFQGKEQMKFVQDANLSNNV